MADTIPRPSWSRRLRHTPMRDVLRGRLTGRLDWRTTLAAAGLPRPAADLIAAVVRRTRLWRSERADVTRELIAHFADGLAAGVDVDTLLADFGDAKTSAKLIRRAKKRNRPLAWHVFRWTAFVGIVLLYVYACMAARFVLGRPSPTVDYLAPINAPILAVAESDRAWPLYRRVIVDCKLDRRRGEPELPWINWDDRPDWKAVKTWVDAHAADIARLREAAAKPRLGFVLGPDGSAYDKGILTPPVRDPSDPSTGSLVTVVLPHLNTARLISALLAADARLARDAGDATRLRHDLDAMLGQSRQLLDESSGIVVTEQVAIGIRTLALDEIERTLCSMPQLLSDGDLVTLAHALSGPRTAADVISLDGERAVVLDSVQRIYTDDGHGDGRLTLRGLTFAGNLRTSTALAAPDGGPPRLLEVVATPALAAVHGSRRTAVERFEQDYAQGMCRLARPLREGPPTTESPDTRRDEWTPGNLFRDDLVGLQVGYDRVQLRAERLLARRDGIQIGLAMELFRRRHDGHWPTTLNELSPGLLPTVPVDPVTGDPLHFKIQNGRPLVYSVGGDRDDDGGRVPTDGNGQPAPMRAAAWPRANAVDGDWPLFPALADEALR